MNGGYIGTVGKRGDDSVPVVMAPSEVWLSPSALALLKQAAPSALDGTIVHVVRKGWSK